VLILLDENLLNKKLKKAFLDTGYTVQNVEDMGWRGIKDRELLARANVFPFDVFITSDKNYG
jgi:predicted nuclease of predicted toxin-antitoxin system